MQSTTIGRMRLLEALASIFINTFGITQPTEKTRRHVSWFILGLLVGVFAVICAVTAALYNVMHR